MKFLRIFYSLIVCTPIIFGKLPASKHKHRKQPYTSSSAQTSQLDLSQELKNLLNQLIEYDDGSIVSELDLDTNVITVINPYDNSTVLITVDDIQYISDDIENLSFEYAQRVADWFDATTIPSNILLETVERHRFAQRVDEIMLLYGRPSYFTSNCGQLVENLTLPGTIITQDGRQLDGIFEYAQTESTNDGQKPLLYHRFLHPNSRAVPI